MENKYYLDEQGLIKVLQGISQKIKDKTSNTITGDTPDNFVTEQAVINYLQDKNNHKLKINQQSASATEDSYELVDNIQEYNGGEEVQINFKLAGASDITNLFND